MYVCTYIGWWFEVTLDPLTGQSTSDRKLWVVMKGDELLCYDDVFEGSLLGKVNCLDIIDVQEREVTSMGISMEGLELKLKDRPSSILWW